MFAEFAAALEGACIDDIITSGYLDTDENPVRFRPLYRAIFIDCGGALLRFGAIGDTGRMLVSKVEALTRYAELGDEFEPAFGSVSKMILDDTDGKNRVSAFHFWDGVESADGIECGAAQIDIEIGQKIFIDPTYYFGIRIRGPEQYAVWLDSSLPIPVHTEIKLLP